MTLPTPIPPELAVAIADRLRVIGDPSRIRILDLLRGEELSVGEIAERLAMSQQNASKHLGVLARAGVVARRKQGTSVLHAIADEGVYSLCEQVCGGLEQELRELAGLVEIARPAAAAGR